MNPRNTLATNTRKNGPQKVPDPVVIRRIRTPAQLAALRPALQALVSPHRDRLNDDALAPDSQGLVHNLATTLPYLWVAEDADGYLWAGASLDDVIPHRHAFIHGVSHVSLRRHPLVARVALAALDCAFEELNVLKVKAEFPADNAGARGFCLRHGFTLEARLKDDLTIGGHPRDVLLWSLFAHTYYQSTRRKMSYVLWQKEKQKS